jgi:CubicO group peptidase (beta-lactamase class C family)
VVEESIAVHVETVAEGLPLAEAVGPSGGLLTLAGGLRQGLGWRLRNDPDPVCSTAFGPRSFGHVGNTGVSLWCDPDRELVVALLTNRVYHGRNAEPLAQLRPALHAAVVKALGGR